MADLTDNQSALATKIVGANSSGVETNPVDATSAGGLHVNLRNNSGTEIATASNPAKIDGNIADAATDSGNPVKIGGVYNSTLPSFTSGNRGNAQINKFGELSVRVRNKYLNITGNTTTTVKSGAGVLSAIIVNNGANATTITIYDNTVASGTKIGTVAVLAINTNVMATLYYDCEFSTGLTIVTAGSASNDITVLYQ